MLSMDHSQSGLNQAPSQVGSHDLRKTAFLRVLCHTPGRLIQPVLEPKVMAKLSGNTQVGHRLPTTCEAWHASHVLCCASHVLCCTTEHALCTNIVGLNTIDQQGNSASACNSASGLPLETDKSLGQIEHHPRHSQTLVWHQVKVTNLHADILM